MPVDVITPIVGMLVTGVSAGAVGVARWIHRLKRTVDTHATVLQLQASELAHVKETTDRTENKVDHIITTLMEHRG